ncbi:MAG: copper resistance protein NlpE N-terminal domain-containing protein [Ferruginibacter sp.]|nr:copper resistance protein NlpE N-terminal domain-containing protein [Cytophagales bacterium]
MHVPTKKFIVLLSLAGSLLGCQGNSGNPDLTVVSPVRTGNPNKKAVVRFAGTYAGVVPCADCDGLETELQINNDGTYVLKHTYLGKQRGRNTFREQGNWTHSPDLKKIALNYDHPDESSFYRVVHPDTLKMLDRRGNEITSRLNYNLARQ